MCAHKHISFCTYMYNVHDIHSYIPYVGVSPPQQLLFVTNSGSLLDGAGVTRLYEAVNPVAINTLSRLMYWYDGVTNSIMVQSLDGNDIWVS